MALQANRKTAIRVGVVAPGSRIEPAVAEQVTRLAASFGAEICFLPQCFLSSGHFAGDDAARARAFVEVANDPSFDALWFARGGYGCGRLIDRVLPALTAVARHKTYLGYSDAGFLLAALYGQGFSHLAHGPMPSDINRADGERAIERALAFLAEGRAACLEASVGPGRPTAAFNITVFCHLIGTPWLPDLSGHVLMLEEVSEYMYAIDRCLFHITAHPAMRDLAGIRLGRCSAIPANQPDFGQTEEEVVRSWCERSGIPYLGRADIGHDSDNKVVPFGRWRGP